MPAAQGQAEARLEQPKVRPTPVRRSVRKKAGEPEGERPQQHGDTTVDPRPLSIQG